MSDLSTTSLEKESLEAHVDLCALRYQNLDKRLTKVETKIEEVHTEIKQGNASLIKVIVGAAGTITAGMLSTIIVLIVKF
jgi:tetrahydromethanopterin S-methyltransferase subunit G